MVIVTGLLLAGIVLSLWLALRALTRGQRGPQMARALTLRVALSIGLFMLVVASKWLAAGTLPL